MFFLVAFLVIVGCQKATQEQATSVESLLFGGEQCAKDTDCASGRCAFGICAGFLMSAMEVTRIRQLGALAKVGQAQETRERIVAMLVSVLENKDSDVFLRARAAHALSAFPGPDVTKILVAALADEEPIRFQAARSLHSFGDQRGTQTLMTFLNHPARGVRALAKVVLEADNALFKAQR